MFNKFFILFLLLILYQNKINGETYVIDLNDDNFLTKIPEVNTTLVMFYKTW